MKKIPLNNRLYDVVTMDEYNSNRDLYNPKFTAIEIEHAGVVLPIKGNRDSGVGIYCQNNDMIHNVEHPSDDDMERYSTDNIIDYSNPKDIQSIINADNLVRDIEKDILTTKENIFHLNIGDTDSPELAGIKSAINSKEVDIKQYEHRFPQYQNDIRVLKESKSITLLKLTTACNAFDINAELILKDKEGCANPMGNEIRISLTGDEV